MNLPQTIEVSEDEQPRLLPPSNDSILKATAGIDRQLDEGPSNLLSACEQEIAVLKEKEEFLRNAFLFLQNDIYPATDKVGRALNKLRENSNSVVSPFTFCDKEIMMSLCGMIQTIRLTPREG
jgi:hypothetical protein